MALGSVEDDGGNSYSLYEKVNSLAKPVGMAFYFTRATTAAQTITVTFGGLLANDTATVALWVYEFVGLSLSPGGSTKLSGSGKRDTGFQIQFKSTILSHPSPQALPAILEAIQPRQVEFVVSLLQWEPCQQACSFQMRDFPTCNR